VKENTYSSDTKIFNGRNFITCGPLCERVEVKLDRTRLEGRVGVLL
jgi:hypothetical protein